MKGVETELDLVHLTIDGRKVVVPPGTSVLEAAEQAGVHIPRLCHDRELVPFGACRLRLSDRSPNRKSASWAGALVGTGEGEDHLPLLRRRLNHCART